MPHGRRLPQRGAARRPAARQGRRHQRKGQGGRQQATTAAAGLPPVLTGSREARRKGATEAFRVVCGRTRRAARRWCGRRGRGCSRSSSCSSPGVGRLVDGQWPGREGAGWVLTAASSACGGGQSGADVRVKSRTGMTALSSAARSSNLPLVSLLLQHGAQVRATACLPGCPHDTGLDRCLTDSWAAAAAAGALPPSLSRTRGTTTAAPPSWPPPSLGTCR